MKTYPFNPHRVTVSPPMRPEELLGGVFLQFRTESYTFTSPEGWSHAWDVTKAQALAYDWTQAAMRGLVANRIQLADFPQHAKDVILAGGVDVDDDHWQSDRCDPHEVLIAVQIGRYTYFIDGSHRTRRAIAMGWDVLPIFLLTPEEDMACRICACCKRKPEVFPVDTILRYGDGPTALMRVKHISKDHAGPGKHRYYGDQCVSGSCGAYHADCVEASPEDRATWISYNGMNPASPSVDSPPPGTTVLGPTMVCADCRRMPCVCGLPHELRPT